jgi:hypothetical protein
MKEDNRSYHLPKRRLIPTRWLYILALIIPIFACAGSGLLVYRTTPSIPETKETLGIQNLTKVIVTG